MIRTTDFVKLQTNNLDGAALGWAVAKAEGRDDDCEFHGGNLLYGRATSGFTHYNPETKWEQGGPIKTENRISTTAKHHGLWMACIYDINDEPQHMVMAQDELTAAMRCYVTAKIGKEIEIPEVIVNPDYEVDPIISILRRPSP